MAGGRADGQHFTVTEVLPRLLDLLASHGVQATFFVEGLNAEMYPQALHTIASAGHEVAVHAWRHEEWAALDADSETALLARATEAMRSIGVHPRGFRPPGGGLTERTLALLTSTNTPTSPPRASARVCSTASRCCPSAGRSWTPTAYLPQFSGPARTLWRGPDPLTPEQMRDDIMIAALDEHAHGQAGHLTLLFHPFTVAFTGEPGWEALDAVLGRHRSPRGRGRDHREAHGRGGRRRCSNSPPR